MAIRAVVFDIGGVLEISPDGREPTTAFDELLARWEPRLGLPPGDLGQRIRRMNQRLIGMGKDGGLGTCSEEEWRTALREATEMDQTQAGAFIEDFWDVYLGQLNVELAAYFAGLRPRYSTALLSNSFVGARERERARYHFDELTGLIIYSHEEGIAKPEPRIFVLTCERLGVRPEETVFLDDAEPSVAAARTLGMRAIHFRDTAQAIADMQTCLMETANEAE